MAGKISGLRKPREVSVSLSRQLFLFLHYFTLFLSLLFFIAALVLYFADLGIILLDYFPDEILYVVIVLSGLTFFVSALAVTSLKRRSGFMFLCYFALSALVTILYVLVFVYMFLYQQDIAVVDELDQTTTSFTDSFVDDVVKDAFENPKGFLNLQNDINCCGMNMKTSYLENASLVLLTGEKCVDLIDGKVGIAEINLIKNTFPVFNESAQELADENPLLGSDDFFCEEVLLEETAKIVLYLGLSLMVVALFEFVGFFCAWRLLWCIPKGRGGFSADEENLYHRHVVKFENTSVPDSWKNPNADRPDWDVKKQRRTSLDTQGLGLIGRLSRRFGSSSSGRALGSVRTSVRRKISSIDEKMNNRLSGLFGPPSTYASGYSDRGSYETNNTPPPPTVPARGARGARGPGNNVISGFSQITPPPPPDQYNTDFDEMDMDSGIMSDIESGRKHQKFSEDSIQF